MKLKFFYLLLIPALISILVFTAFSSNNLPGEKDRNKGVIKFSHQFHMELTDCRSCHTAVVNSTALKDKVFPDHDDCSQCHDVEDTENCSLCHYEDQFEPLIQEEPELMFNHQYHVTEINIECETCHKGFDKIDYSWELENPDPFMADCYTCHNNEKNGDLIATNNCQSCHISTADLLPQDHKSVTFISSHKFSARMADANCLMCHDNNNNSCEDCHTVTNAITEENTADDFYQPYAPGTILDDPKQQKLTRVHELNYRFTHGIDLRGKTAECQSCHEIETFCANCHQSENQDFASSGIVPASHLKPNFFTIGAGTGGGEHAMLARRDIESCASCHNVQGADATCITCHTDFDGIKGTDPKTHPANYMRDENGDWHNGMGSGSICFNCHNSAPAAGVGFCGYCHGS